MSLDVLFFSVLFACSKDKEVVPFVPKATCSDGILNSNETSVDCGGSCGNCKGITIPTQGINK